MHVKIGFITPTTISLAVIISLRAHFLILQKHFPWSASCCLDDFFAYVMWFGSSVHSQG